MFLKNCNHFVVTVKRYDIHRDFLQFFSMNV